MHSPHPSARSAARRRVRIGCLLAAALIPSAPRPIAAHGPGRDADVGPAVVLAARADSLRRGLRLASMRGVPAEMLAADRAYRAHLELLAARVTACDPAPRDSAGWETCVLHLLGARHPAASRWVDRAVDTAATDGGAPPGGLSFWAGLDALERDRAAAACAWWTLPVPPYLQPHADWLRVRALDRIEPAAAGTLAVALMHTKPGHRFQALLRPRAAVHLIEAGEPREALAMLHPRADGLGAPDPGAAHDHLLEAWAWRELGQRAELRDALETAFRDGPAGPDRRELQIELAAAVLPDRRASSALRAGCLRVLVQLGPVDEALALWERWAPRLGRAARCAAGGAVIDRLAAFRRREALLRLAMDWEHAGEHALLRRARLALARIHRSAGEVGPMRAAYESALSATGAGGAAASDAIARTAGWELARELEDLGDFGEAVGAYDRLGAIDRASGLARAADLRAALCAFRQGDAHAARRRLGRACAEAGPRFVGAPCLWLALLGGSRDGADGLAEAAAETRPGYHARRARGARATGAADASFWTRLDARIRDPGEWSWPVVDAALSSADARRLLALVDGLPTAEAAALFAAYGYHAWARDLWGELPGWRATQAAERAAALRSLGQVSQAIAVSSDLASDPDRDGYPIAYPAGIETAARRFALSPVLLLAVIRQESAFDATARSRAGARGLMQLMPGTARRLADPLGCGEVNLERPEDNILLGAAHLAELLDRANGSLPMTLAAYNAGYEHAARWRNRLDDLGSDLLWDAYVETIGFAETRVFVQRVLRHYWTYLELYEDPGRPPRDTSREDLGADRPPAPDPAVGPGRH